MTKRSIRRCASMGLVYGLAMVAVTGFGTTTAPAAALTLPPLRADIEAVKMITVDGQRVRVRVQVNRVDPLASPTSTPTTRVAVTLESLAGEDLPVVVARHVRLDRTRPPARTFRAELLPVLTFRHDPTSSRSEAAGLPAYRSGLRLRATIRLETAGGTRLVRLERVPVN